MINKTEKKILIDFLQHNLVVNKGYDSSIFLLKETLTSFSILQDIIYNIRELELKREIDKEVFEYNINELVSIIKSYNNTKYNKSIEIALNNLNDIKALKD